MELQKIKSILFFLVLVVGLFYLGNVLAREPKSAVLSGGRSTRFLNIVAVLDSIQFDFDFINSLGDASVKTDEYVAPLSPAEATGRYNPFMKSSSATSLRDPNDIILDVSPVYGAVPTNPDVYVQPVLNIGVLPEEQGFIPPKESFQREQDFFPEFPEKEKYLQESFGKKEDIPLKKEVNPSKPSYESSSATLTR